jgi:hypothetical protein
MCGKKSVTLQYKKTFVEGNGTVEEKSEKLACEEWTAAHRDG